jgi:hypothetical protein
MQGETKYAQKLFVVWFVVKKQAKKKIVQVSSDVYFSRHIPLSS